MTTSQLKIKTSYASHTSLHKQVLLFITPVKTFAQNHPTAEDRLIQVLQKSKYMLYLLKKKKNKKTFSEVWLITT